MCLWCRLTCTIAAEGATAKDPANVREAKDLRLSMFGRFDAGRFKSAQIPARCRNIGEGRTNAGTKEFAEVKSRGMDSGGSAS
jgi:hypothetical protein